VAERSEFELRVPLSKLSDNSLMLSFATSRRVVKRSHPGLHLWRASGLSWKRIQHLPGVYEKIVEGSVGIQSDTNRHRVSGTSGDG
jgi:hypothetical protein